LKQLSDENIDVILLMVEESASTLNVHDAGFFEEYEEFVRTSKTLPDATRPDEFASPFVITDGLVLFGLAFLGQIAKAVIQWACKKALDGGWANLGEWLKSQRSASEVTSEVIQVIHITVPISKEMDVDHLTKILTELVEALMRNPEATSKILPR
jgi:hypothetical protein